MSAEEDRVEPPTGAGEVKPEKTTPKVSEAGISKAKKKSKPNKRALLAAKYDLQAARDRDGISDNLPVTKDNDPDEQKPEPKAEGDMGDESDDTDAEFDENASDPEEEEGDEDDEDEDDDEGFDDEDEDDEDEDELSEPEVEYGSRRRREPVDYSKVLATLEAEEREQKKRKED